MSFPLSVGLVFVNESSFLNSISPSQLLCKYAGLTLLKKLSLCFVYVPKRSGGDPIVVFGKVKQDNRVRLCITV